ncbi:hypothetical protein [Aquimarina sp. 2201CG5-10]|uniref:hypothetical protein n=1 Tax=Aquimarina callyspongiae TaxID=3098150 RepID=UPI002AB3BC4A|nr:hypothetical protein [Aquimarina sp. 2201CG5-10]MDY8136766.1 hypothetical protein [Aquimarina sp. 2201CG5-10]
MSIAAMVASIKFNDRRSKREAFSHLGGNTDTKSQGIKIEPISEEALTKIRKKIKKQNRANTIKNIVIALVSVAITTWLFLI